MFLLWSLDYQISVNPLVEGNDTLDAWYVSAIPPVLSYSFAIPLAFKDKYANGSADAPVGKKGLGCKNPLSPSMNPSGVLNQGQLDSAVKKPEEFYLLSPRLLFRCSVWDETSSGFYGEISLLSIQASFAHYVLNPDGRIFPNVSSLWIFFFTNAG